ncbi:hypothetical protein FFLO_01404 [Filobasidium floriforme]|uniref:Cutinase n=1 Tax=Filobasidium floriforme TaxID=5210 RepID=A0A8K0JPR4_9TREE|nr:hypothetical protein FFLO_01404 [Filobasidium floriforme]
MPTPSHSLRKLKSPEPVCEYSGAETEIEERQFSWPGFGGLGGGSGGCNRYEVISARGTGELQAFPTGNRGTVDGILNAVSGGSNYEVMYPAIADFLNGPRQGARDLLSHVQSTLSSCPDTKFVLVGYSQGAMVVVNAENDNSLPVDSVVATILYGNPYWRAGQPENAGTATIGSGSAALTGIRTPEAYRAKTHDVCNRGDNVCTSIGSLVAHLGYSTSPQQAESINFAVSQLRAAGIQ